MSTDKTRVPEAMAERYAAITALTDGNRGQIPILTRRPLFAMKITA
jgi:hypothetical protein